MQLDHLLENVGHQEEQIGGQRAPLAEPPFAAEPRARSPIDKDSELGGGEDVGDPLAPKLREATCEHDRLQAAPIHGVEGLREIQFQHQS